MKLSRFQILHNSIDYLIGSSHQKNISKSCHKYGFQDPEEYESALKFIGKFYRQFITESISETDLLSHFAHFNQDFQRSVLDVFAVRRSEIEEFLIQEHNSRNNDLMMSFDWDLRYILGTNNSSSFRAHILTLILNCKTSQSPDLKTIYLEVGKDKIDKLIEMFEECEQKLSSSE